jgi:hypothetical protein
LGQLIPSIQVTLFGFVYVSALILFSLSRGNKHDLVFKEARAYFPFIAIIILFASYVVGYTAYVSSEKIIFMMYPGLKYGATEAINMRKSISEDLYKVFIDRYTNLIMFRHLFIAILFFLMPTLFIWFRKSKLPKFRWYSILFCITFSIFLLIAYIMTKESLLEFKRNILSH